MLFCVCLAFFFLGGGGLFLVPAHPSGAAPDVGGCQGAANLRGGGRRQRREAGDSESNRGERAVPAQ